MRVPNSFNKVFRFLFFILFFSTYSYARDGRPFWTEKSSYSEGDRVYFVGISSNAKTPEEGRKTAAENAKIEASNFFQLSDINFLNFETQMTFEEKNKNGTLNIFRLMFLNKNGVEKVKNKKIELARKHELMSPDLEIAKSTSANWDKKQKDLRTQFKLLRPGMSESEVIKIMGEPRKRYQSLLQDQCLNYQEYTIVLHRESGLYAPEIDYHCK